jgi:endonuclease/exonuclease/phosphatase (EEP) superfamily protein YafD
MALVAAPVTPRSRRWISVSLAVVALLATAWSWGKVAPLFVGQETDAEPGTSLVLMAQNLEYGEPQALAEQAVRTRVDLLVLSEASEASITILRSTGLQRELPYTVGIDEGRPEGAVVFCRYPLTEVARLSDGGESRAITAHTPQLGNVDLVALHPSPPYQKGAWKADYDRIAVYLRENYPKRADTAKRPVIVAGDFNATLDHAPVRRIRALGFADTVDQLNLGFQPTWPAAGSVRLLGIPVPPFVQIDHILTSAALAPTALSRFHSGGTDHLGLYVELRRARS